MNSLLPAAFVVLDFFYISFSLFPVCVRLTILLLSLLTAKKKKRSAASR
jgi:hypothetical protein